MRHWVGIVSEEQFASERLYARDTVAVPAGRHAPQPGDPVVLVAGRRIIGHGLVEGPTGEGTVLVRYSERSFDDPVPATGLPVTPGWQSVTAAEHSRLAGLAGVQAGSRSVWFVSVALPIEAASRAEAVREFWTYLEKLGPRELPAYVWPLGDELAMQAFVLGAVTNLDPEEDGDDDAG
jgi:hypothetical protein